MSLFSSAFDSGLSAGPSLSATSPALKRNKKRKRPSNSGNPPANQLKGVQANLDKLMKAADAGRLDRPSKGGGESIGQAGKKKKPKSHQEIRAGPSQAFKPANEPRDSYQPKRDRQDATKAARRSKEDDKVASKAEQDARRPAHMAHHSADVAEMPMPHPTPSSKKKGKSAAGGLTAVQSGLQAKLDGARFRWINEQLYSVPSTRAVEMMRKEPKIFDDYHASHRAQTAAWPSPPLPRIITLLSARPRGTVIADLGCGDAELARTLVPRGLTVLSYDLVGDVGSSTTGAAHGWVVEADFLTHVPLPGRPGGLADSEDATKPGKKSKETARACEVVDVVVCCLSLMGTNWIGGIYEACRILKQGGKLHVAEVTSRFTSTAACVEVVGSFGFKLDKQESPSTHFTLFEFTKTAAVPNGPVRGEEGWEDRLKVGEAILKPCVYKKR